MIFQYFLQILYYYFRCFDPNHKSEYTKTADNDDDDYHDVYTYPDLKSSSSNPTPWQELNKEKHIICGSSLRNDIIYQDSPLYMVNYQPPPNADPNAPPPTEFAAIGSNDSISEPGVAAPTKGVESC